VFRNKINMYSLSLSFFFLSLSDFKLKEAFAIPKLIVDKSQKVSTINYKSTFYTGVSIKKLILFYTLSFYLLSNKASTDCKAALDLLNIIVIVALELVLLLDQFSKLSHLKESREEHNFSSIINRRSSNNNNIINKSQTYTANAFDFKFYLMNDYYTISLNRFNRFNLNFELEFQKFDFKFKNFFLNF
jgi:hypothetical protein